MAAENASKSSEYFPPAAVETLGHADDKDKNEQRFLRKMKQANFLGWPLPGDPGGMGLIIGHKKRASPTEGPSSGQCAPRHPWPG